MNAGSGHARADIQAKDVGVDVRCDHDDFADYDEIPGQTVAREGGHASSNDPVAHAVVDYVDVLCRNGFEQTGEQADEISLRPFRVGLVHGIARQAALRWPAEQHHWAGKLEVFGELRHIPTCLGKLKVVTMDENHDLAIG